MGQTPTAPAPSAPQSTAPSAAPITPQSAPSAVAAAIAAANGDPAAVLAVLRAYGAAPAARAAGSRAARPMASPAAMRALWDASGMSHAALDAVVGSRNTYTVAHPEGDRWAVDTATLKVQRVIDYMAAAESKAPDPIRAARIVAMRALLPIPEQTTAERDAKAAAEARRAARRTAP